jgi:hypothetical protein
LLQTLPIMLRMPAAFAGVLLAPCSTFLATWAAALFIVLSVFVPLFSELVLHSVGYKHEKVLFLFNHRF